MKNKKITHAVLFTVRDIENKSIFNGIPPQPSQGLIDFFMSRNDGLSHWLNSKVIRPSSEPIGEDSLMNEYKSIPEDAKRDANEYEKTHPHFYDQNFSLIDSLNASGSLSELQAIKGSFLYVYDNLDSNEKEKLKSVFAYFSKIPDINFSDTDITQTNSFSIKDYEIIATSALESEVTYCDKINPKVQDRLGWYKKEDDKNTVVCAIYPWSGETNYIHNTKWASALIATVKDEYPSLTNIILVCHDRDFVGFSGKDEVVRGIFFNDLHKSFPELSGLVVFQHNNTSIKGALNMTNAEEVYEAINNYIKGFNTIKNSDVGNKNANAHSSFGDKKFV